jgi:hypothetical protein
LKPPRNQFTLGELMGLVALCALGFALLTTPCSLLGAGVLVVVPGFALEQVRGGTGIIGGIVSGCLIPMVAAIAWAGIEFLIGGTTIGETLNFLPALYLLFAACLVWSSLASSLLYVVHRRFQGQPRWKRPATSTGPIDAGIQFLPDDDRPGPVRLVRNAPGSTLPDAREGPQR